MESIVFYDIFSIEVLNFFSVNWFVSLCNIFLSVDKNKFVYEILIIIILYYGNLKM